MEEIKTLTEKHIEVEEDQADQIEVEKETGSEVRQTPKGENKYPTRQRDYPPTREEGRDTTRNSPHQHAEVPEGDERPMNGTKHARMVRVSLNTKEGERKAEAERNKRRAERGKTKREEPVAPKKGYLERRHNNHLWRRRRPRSRERTKKESKRHYGYKRKGRSGAATGDLIRQDHRGMTSTW
ncbi:hypothetical protein CR513_25490, partial [Mucuna pruriens]